MNEEGISALEEQKERRMKKFIWALAAIAFIVVVGVACTQLPATKDIDNSRPPIIGGGWQGGSIDLFGMEMRWIFLESGSDTRSYGIEGKIGSHTDPAYCFLTFTKEDLEDKKTFSPEYLAFFPGLCFQLLEYTMPEGERRSYFDKDPKSFGEYYASIYARECNKYQPLGWGDRKDGVCDLPDPIKIAEEFYGWKP